MDVAQAGQSVAEGPAFRQSVSEGGDFSLGIAQELLSDIVFFLGFFGAWVVSVVGLFDTYLKSVRMKAMEGWY